MISYQTNGSIDIAEICELYRSAKLNRPIEDPERIARMYAGSNLVHSARDGALLVGILRGWTDGAYDGYISDLAVAPDHQKQGIGRELLRRVRESYPDVEFLLRASPIARDYYAHLGWQRVERGWYFPQSERALIRAKLMAQNEL